MIMDVACNPRTWSINSHISVSVTEDAALEIRDSYLPDAVVTIGPFDVDAMKDALDRAKIHAEHGTL